MKPIFLNALWFLFAVQSIDVGAQPRTRSSSEADSAATVDRVRDEVVVTASRTEQVLEDVPASVSLVDADPVAPGGAPDASGALRGVPGLNVAQTSANTTSISTRTATNAIPQGVLAIVDHRTIYQDFNGFVLWSLIPMELEDLDRIEVVRGPGSAVWGANALHGVVHLVSKRPRDMVGTRVKLGGGELGSGFGNATHAGVSGRLEYRISAGYDRQDAFDRPTGSIPGTVGPNSRVGTPYPDVKNPDTERTRVNGRVDYETDGAGTLSFSGGYARLEGPFLSPGGPTSLTGSENVFGKVDWTKDDMRLTAFMNRDETQAVFLLNDFPTEQADYTWNLDFTDTRAIGDRHLLTYGGNARYNTYDNDLAPEGDSRETLGVFVQDDIYVNDALRFVAGARFDYVDPMGTELSPRASVILTPFENQQFRASYSHAFQAPSVLQNYLEFPQGSVFQFPDFANPGSPAPVPVFIPISSLGDEDLEPKRLDAIELAWTSRFGGYGRATLTGYVNFFQNDFFQNTVEFYTSATAPPTWPFDPSLFDGPLANSIPRTIQYANGGDSTERGVEFDVEVRPTDALRLTGSWAWQDVVDREDPVFVPLPDGSRRAPFNEAPRHRVNLGVGWDQGAIFASTDVFHQSGAFWADVLDARFWGPTEQFTMVNAGAGVRLAGESIVLGVNALNLLDAEIQQHVWGDIIGRRITGQITYRF